MKNAACYIRVSTENQRENYSIEEQKSRLDAFCQAKDFTIIEFYTDGGYSGGNLERPALQRMLADLHRFDIIIVYKLDRLSRSQKDTLMLIEDYFLAKHVDFISVCENFDTSSPFGRAMIGILSVFAQLEKDQITERFTMGRVGRAKNGYYHGGAVAPTGYDYVNGQLIINPYEALQIKELFERFSHGYSLYNCWQYMQEHYTTKYGRWKSQSLVRNILKNEVYIGKVKFQGKSYPGKHQAIISEELFYQVQQIFNNKISDIKNGKSHSLHTSSSQISDTNQSRNAFKAKTLLSGLLYCGCCGARFHGEHGNYACYSRTKGDKRYVMDVNCKNKKWKISELDALVLEALSRLDFTPVTIRNSGTESLCPNTKFFCRTTGLSALAIQRIAVIDKEVERLLALYQTGIIPLENICEKSRTLLREKETLQQQTNSSSEIVSRQTLSCKTLFLTLMEQGSLQEKRECLQALVEKIVVTDEDINIILKFSV